HALDGGLLPTRVAWKLGAELARQARQQGQQGSEAVVLWASDTVRDEGAMVAFGLEMLGVRPVWNARGIVKALERLPLEDRSRRDVIFTTSGLFRDLYGNLLVWLDLAARLALDGSSLTIRRDYPELVPALEAALGPLAELADPGSEPLAANRVAAHWVAAARRALAAGLDRVSAGEQAILRIFGDAPGAYGAGVNRLAERSGAWQARSELAQVYLTRMGHAYGSGLAGQPAHEAFQGQLATVARTYLGRASNLYGLMDNNDAFDYLGGLSLAVETVAGRVPEGRVVRHADPRQATVEPLATALLQELRGRYLNPGWLKPLMNHGYAGARTMGSEFLEYLWGWQVTNPDIIRPWVWDEVKRVYLDDALGLGLNEFLEQGSNVHIKTNMLAILLVAQHKGFWQPDPRTLAQLREDFAQLVAEHGLPGSGHTRPDHPMLLALLEQLEGELQAELTAVLAAARGELLDFEPVATTVAEIQPQDQPPAKPDQPASEQTLAVRLPAWLPVAVVLLLLAGLLNGWRGGRYAR
ncbi:MAG: cobaltochelatase subunit CobN, partial [Candidatus Competibacteraceae bacterium]|nr:cobaltochelatase subunit CobN [Candidatus Competibacteraceae bacterium]